MASKRRAKAARLRGSSHTQRWRKEVLARDGHQCTAIIHPDGSVRLRAFATTLDYGEPPFEMQPGETRCLTTAISGPLDVHHRVYKRMGCERLEDGTALCKLHHTYIEERIRWYRGRP